VLTAPRGTGSRVSCQVVGAGKRTPGPIRSWHAAHRAIEYRICPLLSASAISSPTIPDASPRTIAPGTPGLKLRDAPVVTFHVAIGTFCQTGRKTATLTCRNCRFLSVGKHHGCCRGNPKHQQNNRHSLQVQHRGLFLHQPPANPGINRTEPGKSPHGGAGNTAFQPDPWMTDHLRSVWITSFLRVIQGRSVASGLWTTVHNCAAACAYSEQGIRIRKGKARSLDHGKPKCFQLGAGN
jgi:hypothetical protein